MTSAPRRAPIQLWDRPDTRSGLQLRPFRLHRIGRRSLFFGSRELATSRCITAVLVAGWVQRHDCGGATRCHPFPPRQPGARPLPGASLRAVTAPAAVLEGVSKRLQVLWRWVRRPSGRGSMTRVRDLSSTSSHRQFGRRPIERSRAPRPLPFVLPCCASQRVSVFQCPWRLHPAWR